MSGNFVHLHTHSEYSLLDGMGRIKNLVKEAAKLGQPALALTDHGAMHGAVEFFRACKGVGIKPLIGLEAYQTVWGRPMNGRDGQFDRENHHLLLLSRTMTGYRNLLKICSNAHLHGYYYRPRVDHDFLAAHAEGIIATTGCLGAEVPQLLNQGKEKEAYDRLGWYVETFGKENFFIELQEHSVPELVTVNKTLVPWAEKFGLGLVVTNDVHYVREQDGSAHDVLLCVQTGATVQSENRMRMSDGSYFLKSREQMEATFRPFIDLPASAFDNTLRVMEMCDVDLEDSSYHLPDLPIPKGFTYESYLRHKTEEGLARLYGDNAHDDVVQERKERELRIIHEMGFDIYYLIVADLCDFARSRNIWWNVRGSGAGSLVAYCVGITGIDPLKNNLIFERFLNPGRVTMPDFDLDYPDDQREEMIRYTVEKFGEDQVAQIATFGRMKARAAVRDVGRAKGIELPMVDRIAKLIPAIPGKPATIQDCLTEGHEFYSPDLVGLYQGESWARDLLDTSMQVEGVARHSSVHAAAVIVADRELTHYTPLMRGNKNTITSTITQYEFPILESIGLLKVDFLGLSTLSVMREATRLIRERRGTEYTLNNIPIDGAESAEAFKLLSSGEVSGVFQVEGQGMRRVLTEMQPSSFEHIVATISLYRPGPLEYIPSFIKRMHGEEEVEYKHPALEPILAETYGIIVYQEQIIQILSQLAGYTPGDADLVRRAIGKKKASDIEMHKKIFVEGCHRNGIPKDAAAAIYGDIEFFARYGFNKCLPGDVEVIDAETGRLVTVEELYRGIAQIDQTLTCDTAALRLQPGAVTAVMDNGVKPVYRLTTALGRTIEATANHPFYTFDGWRILEELRAGDQIGVPRSLPVGGHAAWPDHEVIALGHLLAEGNLCHPNSVYFYSKDPAQCEDYIHAAGQFTNVRCTVALHKGSYSVYARRRDRAQPPGIVLWAQRLGIWGQTAHTKTIPRDVFTLTNRQIGLLISRMWEGDGHIDVPGRSLFYATASKRMAQQLQHLLLRLGMISSLRTVEFPYKEGRTGYQLFITSHENFIRFAEQIAVHFVSPTRRDQLAQLCAVAPQQAAVKDVVPVAVKHLVRAEKTAHGLTWDALRAACGVAPREFYPTGAATKGGFTRQTLQRLAHYFGSDDLRRYAESDLYWDHVVSIDYVGEKQTYDLEIPATHNFVANDILVHNSHAADYAVICVQTAYLKARYPVEYMAALLLVERDKTEKVVNFINECRRMGIDVLPPDVNYSGLDFEIQARPADAEPNAKRDPHLAYQFPVPPDSAIRFGMAAVKNVGEAPVNAILAARTEGGPFTSLEDFCDRVDLRQVGKRPLECLIKVGAFDRFGKRSQLLDAIDAMAAQSAAVHSARESGQLSMFDLLGAGAAAQISPIRLAEMEEAKGKEKLQWEKELLGVYAMSHPLSQLSVDLANVVTCPCNALDERYHDKNVLLAGMIVGVRTINTKKGDQMAFVQLEDMQGQCEVVVFPRTYAEVKELLAQDNIVVVKGKAQTREGKTSLLADSFQTYVDQVMSVGDVSEYQKPLLDFGPRINGVRIGDRAGDEGVEDSNGAEENGVDDSTDFTMGLMGSFAGDDSPIGEANPFANEPPSWLRDETAPPPVPTAKLPIPPREESVPDNPYLHESRSLRDEENNAPIPLPKTLAESPLTFQTPPAGEEAAPDNPYLHESRNLRDEDNDAPIPRPQGMEVLGAELPAGEEPQAETPSNQPEPASPAVEEAAKTDTPPAAAADAGAEATGAAAERMNGRANGHAHHANGHSKGSGSGDQNARRRAAGRTMQIVFRPSGDLERDKYRLKEIYEMVRDPRGRDRFLIVLQSGQKSTTLAFPNDPCSISERLQQELYKFFRVEVSVAD
ncbi:MAG: DNA polymerase III subunit alpha [Caldilineaceae bacterium]|nr:DNA polymerase III subunit alpha [Caldilineaceae bacterium]